MESFFFAPCSCMVHNNLCSIQFLLQKLGYLSTLVSEWWANLFLSVTAKVVTRERVPQKKSWIVVRKYHWFMRDKRKTACQLKLFNHFELGWDEMLHALTLCMFEEFDLVMWEFDEKLLLFLKLECQPISLVKTLSFAAKSMMISWIWSKWLLFELVPEIEWIFWISCQL